MPSNQTLPKKKTILAKDVVKEIVRIVNTPITTMKLQKLLYYCQAWSLVWDESPLFSERIEAWANGPIVPEIYKMHQGLFEIESWIHGNSISLSDNQKDTISKVVCFYNQYSGQELSELTHAEDPWKDARKGLAIGERGTQEITLASMSEYYSSLL